MKLSELGTRARLQLAMLGLCVLLSAAYSWALFAVIERLEYELTFTVVSRELEEFVTNWRLDHSTPGPSALGLSGYVEGRDADMPQELKNLPPGLYEEMPVAGHEYTVGCRLVDGTRVCLMLDSESVEELENKLTLFSWTWFFFSLLGAIWLANRLAISISSPISRLVAELDQAGPGEVDTRFAEHFHESDARRIAGAIDGFLERLQGFVERERAFTEEASHELRTPLAVIESSLALLEVSADADPQGQAYVRRMQRAAQLMRQAIEALLFLAREEGGAEDSECAVDEMVRNVLSSRGLAGSGEAQVELEPLTISAHPGMAAIVIANLVDNAAQHGGGAMRITLSGRTLVIADEGDGVSPIEQVLLFERRYKGAASRGQGLGLSIVNKVCARLGWQVRLDSAQGRGFRASITFPPTT